MGHFNKIEIAANVGNTQGPALYAFADGVPDLPRLDFLPAAN